MIAILLLALSPSVAPPPVAVLTSPPTGRPPVAQETFDDRYQAARGDVDLLWELYEWCAAPVRAEAESKHARKVLRRIVDLEPGHIRARKQLGHVRADGRWFESEKSLARYRRVSRVESKKARGFVRFRRDYVHPDAVALLRKGMRFDPEHGMWLASRDRRKLERGWRLQDETWIRPDDAARVDDGEWLVDGDWLPLDRAEQRRSKIERMWTIPGPSVRLHTTVRREVARKALHEMNGAVDDLRDVFGIEPLLPLDVCLVRTEEQYDRLAVGDAEGRRAPTQTRGLHVAYSAYFADSWFVREETADEYRYSGMGVSYWNEDYEYGDLYGVHNARLAAAFSYVDGIDPSRATVESALDALPEGGMPEAYGARYEEEKLLPAWLRWGGAVYAERFFVDHDAAADRSRTWPREWSVDNLRSIGGLGEIEEILQVRLDPADHEATRKTLIERGLLVAFLVDGNSPVAKEAHAELKRALASRDPEAITAAVDTVERVLAGERDGILAFAGL